MTEEGQSIEEEWVKKKGGTMPAAKKWCKSEKSWNKAIEELVHTNMDAYGK
jgi:signal-transduction protein with cAMP-binding, CBS, and nucleotidyltransferase domain